LGHSYLFDFLYNLIDGGRRCSYLIYKALRKRKETIKPEVAHELIAIGQLSPAKVVHFQ
jgi:hypothetical protein